MQASVNPEAEPQQRNDITARPASLPQPVSHIHTHIPRYLAPATVP